MVEGQGVEPCERITTLYGLAIRCLTIRPTLQNITLFSLRTLLISQRKHQLYDTLQFLSTACLLYFYNALLLSGIASLMFLLYWFYHLRSTYKKENPPSWRVFYDSTF